MSFADDFAGITRNADSGVNKTQEKEYHCRPMLGLRVVRGPSWQWNDQVEAWKLLLAKAAGGVIAQEVLQQFAEWLLDQPPKLRRGLSTTHHHFMRAAFSNAPPPKTWNSNEDNGEGNVGTIIDIGRTGSRNPEKTVLVQWDCGTCTNYRVGREGAYDLLVLDSAPAGIQHPNKRCGMCMTCIRGARWQCLDCVDFDLCTRCYTRHDHGHRFKRFNCRSSPGQTLPPRSKCPAPVQSKGLFPGARVVRGCHWQWNDQDGGKGRVGSIVKLQGCKSPDTEYSVARVKWENGFENIYRVGHDGKVDLRYVEPGKGMSYCREHLPKCGSPSPVTGQFAVGDKVRVTLAEDVLKPMQKEHGGWNPKMSSLIGKIGHVHRITTSNDVRVQYDPDVLGGSKENCRWTFNPGALEKVSDATIKSTAVQSTPRDDSLSPSSSPERHWSVDSNHTKTGARSGCLDNDLVSSHHNVIPYIVRLPPGTDQGESLPQVDPIPGFIETVRSGDLQLIRKHFKRFSLTKRINETSGGRCALHVAAENGNYDVTKYLIQKGADVNATDERLYTVLHYLILWYENNDINTSTEMPHFSECVKLVLENKFDVSWKDRESGGTLLHFCLDKACSDKLFDFLHSIHAFDCGAIDKDGCNVLHLACARGHDRVSEIILNDRSDLLEVATSKGYTPLHLAAKNGHNKIVEALLRMKASSSSVTKAGDTALHLACRNRHVPVVEALVSTGMDLNARNKHDKTCVELIDMERGSSHFTIPENAKWSQTATALRKHNLLTSDDPTETVDKSLALVCFLATRGAVVSNIVEKVSCPDKAAAIRFCTALACTSSSSPSCPPSCMVCDDEPASVVFHPCQHKLCCPDCAVRVKRCCSCKVAIDKKTCDGEELPDLKSYRKLQDQVVSLEEEKKCQICMERDKDTAAQPCGHTACHQCMEKLPGKKCHVCRKVVKELLRIYS